MYTFVGRQYKLIEASQRSIQDDLTYITHGALNFVSPVPSTFEDDYSVYFEPVSISHIFTNAVKRILYHNFISGEDYKIIKSLLDIIDTVVEVDIDPSYCLPE